MKGPTNGRAAMQTGWDTKSNPHPQSSVLALVWISDWWRANAECFADHVRTPLPPGAGMPLGVKDRVGNDLHIGDTLTFDKAEWGGHHVFTIALEGGEIVSVGGGMGDVTEWCTLLSRWDAAL